ncbi:glycosyltransferase family 2 protein [Flavobacterium sp.]|uniref:glycosyltransferase family 2 protein n=1 Tax=Flavobacterium sp. TaxID=239 RepID=UPI003750FDCF
MDFLISVIIPAYNVERFIQSAVVSALKQPEVNEVVVVDDGSTDTTLRIIKDMQLTNAKIKIYHHKNYVNKGRSATRNLGIKKASGRYLAFLDADDFYLPNRFSNDKKVFQEDVKCEGVYNAVGFHFYRAINSFEEAKFKISTVSQKIKSEELFDSVICSKYGYLHLNGLTVKKSVFDATGLFNESLMVAEDSDIIFKMALKCCLETGIINEPLALRGVHEANVFTREDLYKKYNSKLYESVITWALENQIPIKKIDVTLKWLWVVRFRENNSLFEDTVYWASLFFKTPKLLFSYLSIKYFPVIRRRKLLFPFLYRKK